ncbi:hypothetical protein [Methylosinus trichosporium]|uniref:hypothetical protein n=1 Tax=Methylosinus trichosporium TaxID=426 RepID=UPI0024BB2762|nr:hypothetical protein [Methylosinus trichosporium]
MRSCAISICGSAASRTCRRRSPSFEDALKGYGTDRINAVLAPVLSAIQAAADLGGILTTMSYTAMEPALGPKEVVIPPVARDAFAPTAFVSIVSTADPTVAMLARRQAWDRVTGILAVDVIEAIGDGAYAEWIVSAAAATQSAGQIKTAPVGALTGDTLALQLAQTAAALAARQPSADNLTALAALSLLGDRVLMTDAAGAPALAPLSALGKALLAAASATAARASLGLAAVAASGSASDLSQGTLPAARLPDLQNLSLLGIGGAADATNKLVVKSPAALFDNSGAGMQVKVNKNAVGDTASLLFERGGSARAEVGLIGDDALRAKVSGDGVNWNTAIRIYPTTGVVGFPKGYRAPVAANIPQRNWVTSNAWLSSTTPADNNWFSVCWSPELGLFCAVGYSGVGNRVMTSPDAINWTLRTSAADIQWRSVCWAREIGLFVAVADSGAGNRVMTSPDGIAWTSRTSAADNEWRAVCWSPELGLLVAVAQTGSGSQVMTSPDGINWTLRTSPGTNYWRSVCWAPELGLFVAAAANGTGNRIMTSPDGINWTRRTSAADNNWLAICWSPELGLLVCVANSGTGNRVMTSPDGITWTLRTSAADNTWSGICWSPELGLLVAVSSGGIGNNVMTSPDGTNWTTRASATDNSWNSVCWSRELGLFAAIAVSGTGNRAMTSKSAYSYSYR